MRGWRAYRWPARLSIVTMGFVGCAALGADCLASDLPVMAHVDGSLYVLPNVFRPVALQGDDHHSIRERSDWSIAPLVEWGPNQQDKGHRALESPSSRHWLGTDTARRDVLARLIHGSRTALLVGLGAMILYVFLGTLLGLLAGYVGGWVDALVTRVIETLMAVPVLFLLLALLAVTEDIGLGTVILVIALVYWTRIARLVRAETRRLKEQDFVIAARGVGVSGWRIIMRHILPNAAAPIIVSASFGVASSVLVEAALSFLGLGISGATPSWGSLMRGALGDLGAWWLAVFPGLSIFVTVAACNFFGDAMRDRLDPRAAQ